MASDMYFNTEIRVYLANSADYYKNLDGQSDLEDVMDCAEAQGNVMTLHTFIDLFNKGELTKLLKDPNTVMRMAEFDLDQYAFIREI